MRTFLDTLERQLAEAAAPAALPTRRGQRWLRPSRRDRGLRRPLLAGGGLTLAVSLVAVALTAGSSADLPVLGARPADASPLAGKPGVPPADRFDLAASRSFPTPDGPGHVVPSRDDSHLCVVLPDRAAPGTYGSGCATLTKVSTRGLAGEMVEAGHRRNPGRSLVAFILPTGAGPAVELRSTDGAALPVSVHTGVAVATLETEAVLRFDVGGKPRQHRFEAPFVDRGVAVDCGHHAVPVRPPSRPGKSWRLGDRSRWCK